jgi:hypothetical protein
MIFEFVLKKHRDTYAFPHRIRLIAASVLFMVHFVPLSAWISSPSWCPLFRNQRLPGGTTFVTTSSVASASSVLLKASSFKNLDVSYGVALAVVPPDDAWDRLQRARYFARDVSYCVWPPCIRLFHPFVVSDDPNNAHEEGRKTRTDDVAFKIADIIEKYEIEPFEISLTEWSIIPHQEELSSNEIKQQQLFIQSKRPKKQSLTKEELETQELIEREAEIGREKLRQRKVQRRRKEMLMQQSWNSQPEDMIFENNKTENTVKDKESEELDIESESTQRVTSGNESNQTEHSSLTTGTDAEVFDGPCVLVLEPDEASLGKLQALRYLLAKELSGAEWYAKLYSPTGSFNIPNDNNNRITRGKGRPKRILMGDFRPVVPIASFPTVSSAIPVARKLRQLWNPLTFNVTDLHILSCQGNVNNRIQQQQQQQQNLEDHSDELLQGYFQKSTQNNWQPTASNTGTRTAEEERHFWSGGGRDDLRQYGCDALISFLGEEIPMDEQLNRDVANFLLEKGEKGGFDASQQQQKKISKESSTNSQQHEPGLWDEGAEDGGDEDTSALEQWLFEEDDNHDDGTVVVIGRAQFFTGEMRQYVGMPASSALDGRDRISPDVLVSGAARRRGAIHRSRRTSGGIESAGSSYLDGDFGRKSADVEPWGKRREHRRKKTKENR